MSNFYVVNEDSNYIKITSDNQYTIVENREDAKLFSNTNSVTQVLKCIPKPLKDKHKWRVESENTGLVINDEYIKIDREEVIAVVETISSLLRTLNGNKQHLNRMLSNVDQERQDVLHFLENYRFSASEGYMKAKQIKEISNRRREIKNELRMIENLGRMNASTLSNGTITRLLKAIDEQTYTPRVLTEMFDGRVPQD